MLRLNDVEFDVEKTLGKNLILAEVTEYYDFDDKGQRKGIAGYKYRVLLKDKNLHDASVKIAGAQQMDATGYPAVELDGAEINVYVIDGHDVVSVTATGIHEKKNTPKM